VPARSELAGHAVAQRSNGGAAMMPRLLVSVVLTLAVRNTDAQQIRGRVVDAASDLAVAASKVELLDRGTNTLTYVLADSGGHFEISAPQAGRFRLRASRIGYSETVTKPFDVFGGETVQLELRVAVAAVPLEPLRVTARGRTPSTYLQHTGFYERELHGVGNFLTRYEIEKRGGSLLSDAMRSLPGVRLRRVDRIGQQMDIHLRNMRCPPTVYLDGAIVRLGGPSRPDVLALDDLVLLSDIDGIEVYAGPGEVPAAFNRSAHCGVVVLWTRRKR
jgi:hypothetical protein